MKVVILAGGYGTRLMEETVTKPKPMVEIGGRPMLWHIMKCYSHYGFNEFVIALGYKGGVIKDYFLNYHHRDCDLSLKLTDGSVKTHNKTSEDWTVHLLDTGIDTQTGGRIRKVAKWIGREPFMLTYGDGVSNVDIPKLIEFHKTQKKVVTVTAVRPPSRFGSIVFDGSLVSQFEEKSQTGESWINGGFFVMNPEVVDYIADEEKVFEKEPMEKLAKSKQLAAYRHEGFWQCMDTQRDVKLLDEAWKSGAAPWKR